MEQFQQDQLSDLNLQVDGEVRQHLGTAAKWSKFISIFVFVFCGIFLLIALAASTVIMSTIRKVSPDTFSFLGDASVGIIIGILVFIIAVMGVVYYFLYNFSVKIKLALLSEDVDALNKGLASLKTFFIITTIFSVLALLNSIYTLFR
ncbi:MAG: hypothetical protein QM737_02215 [Ferruginibacter sp.]